MTRDTNTMESGGRKADTLDPISFRPSPENSRYLAAEKARGIAYTFTIQKALDALRKKARA